MLNADMRDISFISEFDGLEISAVIAAPPRGINGIVQLVHGMNEHKERYYDFMDYLAEEGFATVIHDHRGHGGSIADPGDLGFLYKNGGEGLVADISQLNRNIHSAYPDLPVFMIAHDMGALAARCFLRQHDSGLNGLILLGSPSYSRFSAVVRAINSALVQGLPSHERPEKTIETIERFYCREFSDTPHSWLSSRKDVVEQFNADPKCNFDYTVNGYEALLWLMQETCDKSGWDVSNPRLPIRFISGRDDPVMLSEKKFFKSMAVLEKVGYESISHRLFDGMRHDVLNEKGSDNVYRDIAKSLYSWIDRIKRDQEQV